MSEEKRSFSRVPVRLKAKARVMRSIDSPQLFTGDALPQTISREALLKKGKLSEELATFLLEMNRKLDEIVGLLSQDFVKTDFSIDLEVMEISAAGLKFRTPHTFKPGDPLEIILFLSQAPLRMAGSKGRILDKEEDTGLYRLEFLGMRGSDMETIVQFVFKEQREQIRNSKM